MIKLYERDLLFNTNKFDDIKEVLSCKKAYKNIKKKLTN